MANAENITIEEFLAEENFMYEEDVNTYIQVWNKVVVTDVCDVFFYEVLNRLPLSLRLHYGNSSEEYEFLVWTTVILSARKVQLSSTLMNLNLKFLIITWCSIATPRKFFLRSLHKFYNRFMKMSKMLKLFENELVKSRPRLVYENTPQVKNFPLNLKRYNAPLSILDDDMSLDSPISMCLPSRRGKGLCALLVAEYLIDQQNNVLALCRELVKPTPR